ncbi:MAG: DoxX family membrane protein [Paludibacter sp.]|nr:DoxX family membrane protein [Paludibacter sp.]
MKKNNRILFEDKSNISTFENIILNVIRLALSALFIFSGFVKAVDPLGTAYKFADYFHSFDEIITHTEFFSRLDFLALPFAFVMIAIEFLIGLNLLFKIYPRLTSLFALLFMCVMTPLTLYIYIENPVTDCGCFGDALVISNSATFWKNIVLLAFAIYLFIRRKYIKPLLMPIAQIISELFLILAILGFMMWNLTHLPVIDFRPYKIGTNIEQAMTLPENAKSDVYDTKFIYQKNGVQQEFTLENYPKNDSTWVFVEQKSTLISKGDVPKIHDFSITDPEHGDITDYILSNEGKTYLVIMYDLTKTSKRGTKKIEKLYQMAQQQGIPFYALSGSGEDEIENFRQKTSVTFPFCSTDPITLKTIIRANPGIVLIGNGTIIDKWAWRDFSLK